MPAGDQYSCFVDRLGRSRTCHFRHCGLNDGRPWRALFASLKTYSWFSCRRDGHRCGRSLAEYVVNGKRSKRRLIGAGTVKNEWTALVPAPELVLSCCGPSLPLGGIATLCRRIGATRASATKPRRLPAGAEKAVFRDPLQPHRRPRKSRAYRPVTRYTENHSLWT